jgi:hypothetical protein
MIILLLMMFELIDIRDHICAKKCETKYSICLHECSKIEKLNCYDNCKSKRLSCYKICGFNKHYNFINKENKWEQ